MQKLRRLAWVRFAFTDGAARRASSTAAAAPFLVPKPRTLECSGFKWIDEYSWLQHDPREAPRLAQEEARHFRRWARKVGADSLTAQLRDEVLSALPSQTSTPPEVLGNYEYFVEQTEERPLPCYLRRHVRDLGGSGGDQVVIDTNELAAALGDDISVEQVGSILLAPMVDLSRI